MKAMSMPSRKRIRLDPSIYREDGRVFSVAIGTQSRLPVFLDLSFGIACINSLNELRRTRKNRVLAYCLMPDHVHLLLSSCSDSHLPSFVGAWKSACYHERRRRGSADTLWQRSFFDHALRDNEDVAIVATYILNNPVRKGLVRDFHDYPLCGSFEFDL
jgi:putative transposase